MARVTLDKVEATKRKLLEAARNVLIEQGFSGLSTRRVADVAGTQMSQIQYHFGSKQGLILALFESMNVDLLKRQSAMFEADDIKLSDQWDMACDFLEDDIRSGYVRVFQELIAAGWANDDIRAKVTAGLKGWHDVLERVATRTMDRHGAIGPLSAKEVAALVSAAFVGAEAQILLGLREKTWPIRSALRKIGGLIRLMEDNGT